MSRECRRKDTCVRRNEEIAGTKRLLVRLKNERDTIISEIGASRREEFAMYADFEGNQIRLMKLPRRCGRFDSNERNDSSIKR